MQEEGAHWDTHEPAAPVARARIAQTYEKGGRRGRPILVGRTRAVALRATVELSTHKMRFLVDHFVLRAC